MSFLVIKEQTVEKIEKEKELVHFLNRSNSIVGVYAQRSCNNLVFLDGRMIVDVSFTKV